MIARLFVVFLTGLVLLSSSILTGCGGGGSTGTTGGPTSGGGAVVTGRVLSAVTGAPVVPAPSIQTTSGRVSADEDGAFTAETRVGATSIIVDTASFGVFTFTTLPAGSDTTDVGDLYVGPERVTVTGTLRDSGTNAAIANASVDLAGRRAVTDFNGRFTLTEIAYSSTSPGTFLGYQGNAAATGYVNVTFGVGGNVPTGGTLDLGTITLTQQSDSTPPGTPATIFGTVLPAAVAPGTLVSLRSGETEVRRFTVGANGQYAFFVGPGAYTLTFTNGNRTLGPIAVTLTSSTDVQRRDVTLP